MAPAQDSIEDDDAHFPVFDVSAITDPDAATVDVLARLQVAARRGGCEIRFRHACDKLKDLIDFVGLRDVLPCELGVEPRWQSEQRKQACRIEEERDPGDGRAGDLEDL